MLREDSKRPIRVVAFDRTEVDDLGEALKKADYSFEYFKGKNVEFSLIAADEARQFSPSDAKEAKRRLLRGITPYRSKEIGGIPFYSVTDQIDQAHQIWQDIEDGG